MKFNLRSLAAAAVLLAGSITAATAAPVLATGDVFVVNGLSTVTVSRLDLKFDPVISGAGQFRVNSVTSSGVPAVGVGSPGSVKNFGQSNVPLEGTGIGAQAGAITFDAAPSVVFVAQNALDGGAGLGPYSFTSAATARSAVGSITTLGYAFVDLDGDQALDANERAYSYELTMSATFANKKNAQVIADIQAPGGSATANWSGTITISNAVVPEPASLALMGLALTGLAGLSRRRKPQA